MDSSNLANPVATGDAQSQNNNQPTAPAGNFAVDPMSTFSHSPAPAASPALVVTPPQPLISNDEIPVSAPPVATTISTPVITPPNDAPDTSTAGSNPEDPNTAEPTFDDLLNKDILELMGVKDMPESKKQELYQKMLETVQNRVINRVGEQLSDEDVEAWNKVAETKDQGKMEEFLQSKSIDLGKMMMEESLVYKAELVRDSAPIRQASNKDN